MPFLGAAGIGGLIAFLKAGALPSAITGGILSEDATYYYRTFKGSGSLTVTGGTLPADIIVVAGGGAGSQDRGGGGGAGGLVTLTAQVLTPAAHVVTIGAGGAGRTTGQGLDGSNSQFASLTAAVGGGGGGDGGSGANGRSGGSGGGGGNNPSIPTGAGGAATSGQGYAGGTGTYSSPNYGAGGGGGAAGAGGNGTSTSSGNGGSGAFLPAYTFPTGTGVNGYLAGGGGAGSYLGGTNGTGGAGGGGAGVRNGTSNPGVTNTGGGGGSNGEGGSYAGGSGGSGVVIVRYKKTAVKPSTDSYELIGTITLTSSQPSITFTGIPASQYKHLQIRAVARTDRSATSDNAHIRFNGDTATNYFAHILYGANSSAASGAYASQAFIYCAGILANSSPAGAFGTMTIDILDAFSSSKYKTIKSVSGFTNSSTDNMVSMWSGTWGSTTAISSLTITGVVGNFVAGSKFSLLGIRG